MERAYLHLKSQNIKKGRIRKTGINYNDQLKQKRWIKDQHEDTEVNLCAILCTNIPSSFSLI